MNRILMILPFPLLMNFNNSTPVMEYFNHLFSCIALLFQTYYSIIFNCSIPF